MFLSARPPVAGALSICEGPARKGLSQMLEMTAEGRQGKERWVMDVRSPLS